MLKLLNNRIVFLDILRAFAVIAMIQGHTVDVLLKQSYSDNGSFFYYLWNFNRGLTAPIFLFTAGCVFTFIFRIKDLPFSRNPRVKKGLIRAGVLILIGYLIKFPTSDILHYANISQRSWLGFYAIDVLQLIGVGLVLLLFLFYLQEKLRLNTSGLLISSVLILLLLTIICENINWYTYLHPFPAGYLNMGEGAKFPLLPNLSYMLSGAVLGHIISKNRKTINRSKLRNSLLYSGIALIVIYELLNLLHHQTGNPLNLLSKTTNMVFIRTGMVILIVLLIMELSAKVRRLPKIVEVTGTYTLLIYVVHLFILYGSAWNRGVAYYYSYSLNFMQSVLSALALIILMVLLAYCAYYLEEKRRRLKDKPST